MRRKWRKWKWWQRQRASVCVAMLLMAGAARSQAEKFVIGCNRFDNPEQLDTPGVMTWGLVTSIMIMEQPETRYFGVIRRVRFYRDGPNIRELSTTSTMLKQFYLEGKETEDRSRFWNPEFDLRVNAPLEPSSTGEIRYSVYDTGPEHPFPLPPVSPGTTAPVAPAGDVDSGSYHEVVCHPCPNMTEWIHSYPTLDWYRWRLPEKFPSPRNWTDPWIACGWHRY